MTAILVLSGIVILFCFAERKGLAIAAPASSSKEWLEHLRSRLIELARGRRRASQDLSLHAVIRRRVPTGPDPIHNRRVGTYRQLPGA
ncbi:hypothetical protein MLD38_013182 [Melastoma candidum]|uniref:Uncharacterized protein n=1 Tax=Melastoma candidum TaxID=119954 RepID=A0ACB9R8Q4_9MYRT|nr:hypothetical protein MLD38_013182 [Melastoma candidum]